LKQIVAWVTKNKEKELIEANKKYNVPIIFVNSLKELEEKMGDFVIFYPPLIVNDNDFITLLKKHPIGTFNAICDMEAFNFDVTNIFIEHEKYLPNNPDVSECLIDRFIKGRKST